MLAFLRSRWGIVIGSMIGLIVGSGAILKVSFSLFLMPITQDLGWSRAGFSAALMFSSVTIIIMQPIFGWLLDTYGVKRTILPLILLMNVGLVALSMMSGNIQVFYLIYMVIGVASCAQAPPMYAKVVSMWFDRERGLALAIATSGAAIGTMLIPLFVQHLISLRGWRDAYVGIALLNLAIALPVAALILREPPGYVLGRSAKTQSTLTLPPGVEFRQALRGRRFWILAAIFLLLGVGLNGTLTHSIALLTDRGWTAQKAVALLSASGVASILGRFVSGWVLDRSHGPAAPALLILVGAIGCMLFATGWEGMTPYIALPLLSFCYGADVDIMAFFASRYFGLRSFGQIYGTAFSAFAVGSGIGPILMGRSHDVLHTYSPALTFSAVSIVGAYVLVRLMGPYIYTTDEGHKPAH